MGLIIMAIAYIMQWPRGWRRKKRENLSGQRRREAGGVLGVVGKTNEWEVGEKGGEKLGREMVFSQLWLLIFPSSRYGIHPYS
jgi:hypothetical protein